MAGATKLVEPRAAVVSACPAQLGRCGHCNAALTQPHGATCAACAAHSASAHAACQLPWGQGQQQKLPLFSKSRYSRVFPSHKAGVPSAGENTASPCSGSWRAALGATTKAVPIWVKRSHFITKLYQNGKCCICFSCKRLEVIARINGAAELCHSPQRLPSVSRSACGMITLNKQHQSFLFQEAAGNAVADLGGQGLSCG